VRFPVAVDGDWRLFRDWCLAAGLEAEAATSDTVAAFMVASPSGPGTLKRRLTSIRRVLSNAGLPFDNPAEVSSTVHTGDGLVSVREALAQLPVVRYPVGLRGRRDGWLLVLIGVLGFTRNQAVNVRTSDVRHRDGFRIGGLVVPEAEAPGECPACAVSRWLRVVSQATLSQRSELRALLDSQTYDFENHDCGTPLPEGWRAVPTLAPAIDRYGWVSGGGPLSLLAVSQIVAARQTFAEAPKGRATELPMMSGRFVDATSQELAEAYDSVDADAEALLARTVELLTELDGTR
jgi:hypothetical protein